MLPGGGDVTPGAVALSRAGNAEQKPASQACGLGPECEVSDGFPHPHCASSLLAVSSGPVSDTDRLRRRTKDTTRKCHKEKKSLSLQRGSRDWKYHEASRIESCTCLFPEEIASTEERRVHGEAEEQVA